jgi:tripartite-type tricarboxylate transporter receptor subunit TctC
VLVVHPSVPAHSIKELLALARAKPGALNYASGGNGTNLHIAIELFKNLSGAKLMHVPYKGGGMALTSVLAGETEITIPSVAAALPQIKAGRLRALAISSERRSPLLPQAPTMSESGVPGYEFSAWVGVLAPATTSPALVAAINGYWVKAARSPELTSRLTSDGNEVVAGTAAEFGALIKAELPRWNKVIKASGIKSE